MIEIRIMYDNNIWVKLRREYIFGNKCFIILVNNAKNLKGFLFKNQVVIHHTDYGEYCAVLPSRRYNPMTVMGKNIFLEKYFAIEKDRRRKNMFNLVIIDRKYNLTDVSRVISSYF
jgi:hypothetical protein